MLQKLSVTFFHFENRLLKLRIIIKSVSQLFCESLFNWTKLPNKMTDCLRKMIKWNKLPFSAFLTKLICLSRLIWTYFSIKNFVYKEQDLTIAEDV